jgi:hypothetical protein
MADSNFEPQHPPSRRSTGPTAGST